LQLEAPLAGDLRATLDRLGGPGTVRLLDQKNALGSGSLPPPADSGSLANVQTLGPQSGHGPMELDLALESMRPPILSDDS
jgi:hypothetical protein